MKVIYVSHPLGSKNRKENRVSAARWCGWIAYVFECAISADWIVLSGEWEETPENRRLGLAADLEMVTRADELWMVGPFISAGMLLEMRKAEEYSIPVRNLVGYTREQILAELRPPVAEALAL